MSDWLDKLKEYAPSIASAVLSGGATLPQLAYKAISDATGVDVSSIGQARAAVEAADPETMLKLKQADHAFEIEKRRMAYENTDSARSMHKENHEQADKIADRVMKWNLAYVILTLGIQCVSIYLLKDFGTQLTIISTACGWVLKGLLDERRDVTGFYFGSALGSRLKDDGK
jgi:hypothetical protein